MHTLSASSPQTVGPAPQTQVLRICSHELMRGQRIIEIDHSGQRYTLRVTRENKLLLTK